MESFKFMELEQNSFALLSAVCSSDSGRGAGPAFLVVAVEFVQKKKGSMKKPKQHFWQLLCVYKRSMCVL